jgi:HEAT repeat protein
LKLVKDSDPTVRLQAIIALGRIGDTKAVPALTAALTDSDAWVAFASRQALRRINDWKPVAAELASTTDTKQRDGILMTLELVYDVDAAKTLAAFSSNSLKPSEERARALLYLSTVHRKRKPWDGKWWGTRPYAGKPPAKVDEWEGTPIVIDAIRSSLSDTDLALRASAVKAVKETGDVSFLPALRERFVKEENADLRRDLALALGSMEDREALPLLVAALGNDKTPEPVREAALTGVVTIGGDLAVKTLIDVLGKDDVPVERQPRLIAALAKFKAKEALPVLLTRSQSKTAAVRVASVEALGAVGTLESAGTRLRETLNDGELDVRNASLAALANLKDRESIPAFLEAYTHASTRFEATMALAALPDTRSLQVYLAGLSGKNQDLRKACSTALSAIRDEAAPILDQLNERHELPGAAVPELVKIFTGLKPISEWRVLGPFSKHDEPPVNPEGTIDLSASVAGQEGKPTTWKLTQAIDAQGQVDLGKVFSNNDTVFAYGYAEINADTPRKAQLAVGSDDTLTVWLNGKKVYEFLDRRGFDPDAARVDVDLVKGVNRVVLKCGNEGGGWQFSVGVTAAADYAFL